MWRGTTVSRYGDTTVYKPKQKLLAVVHCLPFSTCTQSNALLRRKCMFPLLYVCTATYSTWCMYLDILVTFQSIIDNKVQFALYRPTLTASTVDKSILRTSLQKRVHSYYHLRIVAFLAANLLCTLRVCLYSNIILCCSNESYVATNLHEVYSNAYHWSWELWPSSYIIITVHTYIHTYMGLYYSS